MQQQRTSSAAAAAEADAAAEAAHAEHAQAFAALQHEIDALNHQQHTLQAQLEQAVAEAAATFVSLGSAQDRIAVLEAVRDELQGSIMSLEITVANQARTIGEREGELQDNRQQLQGVQQALLEAIEQRNDAQTAGAALSAQLEDAKIQYKTFSDKTKARLEQKDQAIDSLTNQISQHIGSIAEMEQLQKQQQLLITEKDSALAQLQSDFENETNALEQRLALADEAAQMQQQQHATSVADYETQVATIQSSAALQLHEERAASAVAATQAAALAQELGQQLQHSMQALSDAEKIVESQQQEAGVTRQEMQELGQRAAELDSVANQQRSAITDLQGMLNDAAREVAALEEEQEQLLRCLDTAGEISLMKDEKAALLTQTLQNTEQLLREREAVSSQTAASLSDAQQRIALHMMTITELQATVAQLEGQVSSAEAAGVQLQHTLQEKQQEFQDAMQGQAACLAESNAQLQASQNACEEYKSVVAQLQQELAAAGDAAEAMQRDQEALMLCMAAADDVILLKDSKTAALVEQLGDMERLFEAAAQAASELEQELEQVTGLADVTQLQLDTATAEAEAAAKQHAATTTELAAAAAECLQLQSQASEGAQQLLDTQKQLSDMQHAAAAQHQALVVSLTAKEAEFDAAKSRGDSLAASVDRLQQLLRDVQDSASAAEQRSAIAEELAREMYSHTHAPVSTKTSGGGASDDAVHELRGQVAALQQELQERAKEQMDWLQEMDGMRRLIQVR
jgi:chromosome segregation ATPase